MKSSLLLFLILGFSITAFSSDDGEEKEKYLHNIYKKFHSQPTSDELWEKAISQRKSQEYTITKGDNLWDISRTLFADGFFWSKVWSLNPFITNPHQISVGQVIHFFHGSGLEAPGLKLNESSSAPALTPDTQLFVTKWWQSQDVPPGPVDLADVLIPPPTRLYPKALESFPSSLPNWYFQTDSGKQKATIEVIPVERIAVESVLSLPYYISAEDQNVQGKVFEIEKDAKTASERDFVFIDADEDLQIGSTYTVIRSNGKIRDPDSLGDYPQSYVVQGEVQIVGLVEDLYKAQVTLALMPIEEGAEIIPGSSPKMNLTEPGNLASINAMIVGGENDTTRSLFGPQSVIFLNRGADDGLKVNQRAPVMALHRMRNPESSIVTNTWKLAEVKIVKVEPNYSTAIIMEATDGVMPGDIVGSMNPSEMRRSLKKLNASTSFGFDDDAMVRRKEKHFSDLLGAESEDEGDELDNISDPEAEGADSEPVQESKSSKAEIEDQQGDDLLSDEPAAPESKPSSKTETDNFEEDF